MSRQLYLVAFSVFFCTLIAATNRYRIFDTAAIAGADIGTAYRRKALLRLILGFAVTNFGPVLLAFWNLSAIPEAQQVRLCPFLGVFLLAIATFGFNRLWACLASWPPISHLMYDDDDIKAIREASVSRVPLDARGHAIGALLYLIVFTLLGRWLLTW